MDTTGSQRSPFRVKKKQRGDVTITEMVVSRTFNDGNYESTRIELHALLEKGDDSNRVFHMTLDKIHELRQEQIDKTNKGGFV